MKPQMFSFTGENSDILAGRFLAAGGGGAGFKIFQHAETQEIRVTNVNCAALAFEWVEISAVELTAHLAERENDAADEKVWALQHPASAVENMLAAERYVGADLTPVEKAEAEGAEEDAFGSNCDGRIPSWKDRQGF